MPAIDIRTSDPAYQRMLADLTRLRGVLAPRARLLGRMSPELRQRWLAGDPLLREALQLARDLHPDEPGRPRP